MPAHSRTKASKPPSLSNIERSLGPIVDLPIGTLKAYPGNPRRHPEKQIVKLMASIAEFGFTIPVLVIALFHLDPGKASAWSHNKVGEESFLVLKGTGTVWIGNTSQPVRAGSFIVIPADHIRSIRASAKEPLEFYALTTPAWSKEDDVLAPAPAHTVDTRMSRSASGRSPTAR